MSFFSNKQLRKLVRPLDRSRVKSREIDGRELHYVEGWFAISEANAIFGYDGWDREMVHFERVFERTRSEGTSCGYMARVKISVRAGAGLVMREGTGFGHALARWASDAHERAIKAAETDATKRALATFGSRFGLLLYDKEHKGDLACSAVLPPAERRASRHMEGSHRSPASYSFVLTDAAGAICADRLSAEGFCGGLRQLVDAAQTVSELTALRSCNRVALEQLRTIAPMLKSTKGEHYVDILERLIATRLVATNRSETDASNSKRDNTCSSKVDADASDQRTNQDLGRPVPDNSNGVGNADSDETYTCADQNPGRHLSDSCKDSGNTGDAERNANNKNQSAPSMPPCVPDAQHSSSYAPTNAAIVPNPSKIAPGGAIDKAMLSISTERRIRNKTHLAFVASKPCLICEELPCHAHHVTFAQARGLSIKVSDEFTVPLCVSHHNEVHRSGSEKSWWRKQGLDPLASAQMLWSQSCAEKIASIKPCSADGVTDAS